MEFIKKHIVSIIIISLLSAGCIILIKTNSSLKEERDIKEAKSEKDFKRVSSLILEFNNDLQYYRVFLENLTVDFQYYSRPSQKMVSNQEKYLTATVIYIMLGDLREKLNGFDYMRNFPHYYQNVSLIEHFSKIRDIEKDLRKLILNERDSLNRDDGYIWARDTLILSKFDELKEEAEHFQEIVASEVW